MHWSEVKQQVFRFDSSIVVSAGAGSGKTAALVELYLRLLAGETSLPRPLAVEEIVAITFTDKAAAEMKERVREALRKRLQQGEPGADWGKLLRTLPGANISTFHAFCSRILRENPAEACVDPAFAVLDAYTSAAELQAALEEVIKAELTAHSPQIRALLEQFPLSARGHGKGLREHLIDLHWQRTGSKQDNAALLGTAAAWEERASAMFREESRRLHGLLPEVARILETKEAVFHARLRELPALFHQAPLAPDSIDTPRLLASMRGCIAGNWGKEKAVRDQLTDCLDTLLPAWHQILGAPLVAALLHLLLRLEDAYGRRKVRRGALDFEDLQLKTRDLLLRDPQLREEYRQKLPVVMVDEFQDTNPLQKELVELLCGGEQRMFIVGDPKQSIYLFRGADVTVFSQIQRELAAGGGQNLYFQESFRSRPALIAFVNQLFSDIMIGGADFEVKYGMGDLLAPQRQDQDPTPCVELLRISTGENADEQRRLEATAIAGKIHRLVAVPDGVAVFDRQTASGKGGEAAPLFVPRPPRFGDIAILFRRFSNLKIFERELRQAGIPYYVVKGKGFYRCQELLDLLNFLKYLEFGGDLTALAGVLRSPLCGISDETLYLLGRNELGLGGWGDYFRAAAPPHDPLLWQRIAEPDQARMAGLARLIARLKPLKDRLNLTELLEECLSATGFVATLLTTFQGEQKVANLRKFLEFARTFAERGGGALRDFVNQLTALVEAEPTEAEASIAAEGEDVVRLMTIHQSKGLEFPIVFVPELGGGLPPDHAAIKYDESLGFGLKLQIPGGEATPTLAFQQISELRRNKEAAEQKRLFYVALTRARDYLVLSGEGRGEWRAWVDAFCNSPAAPLLKISDSASPLVPPLAAVSSQGAVAARLAEPSLSAWADAVQHALAYRPPRPTTMVFSPTALEDYQRCPRKYYYKAVMGLDEGLFAQLLGDRPQQRQGGAPGYSPLEQGNLAHALLERLDFSADATLQRAACERLAALTVVGPPVKAVGEVIDNVLALAAFPLRRELAGKRLLREHPFILKICGSASYYLKGTMDLVAVADEVVTVYDYKYLQQEQADLEGYRFQLSTYMLALAKGYPGRRIEGKLLFLKGGGAAAITCDFASFEALLLATMEAIRAREAEADFGLLQGCDGSHCPFRQRCR